MKTRLSSVCLKVHFSLPMSKTLAVQICKRIPISAFHLPFAWCYLLMKQFYLCLKIRFTSFQIQKKVIMKSNNIQSRKQSHEYPHLEYSQNRKQSHEYLEYSQNGSTKICDIKDSATDHFRKISKAASYLEKSSITKTKTSRKV